MRPTLLGTYNNSKATPRLKLLVHLKQQNTESGSNNDILVNIELQKLQKIIITTICGSCSPLLQFVLVAMRDQMREVLGFVVLISFVLLNASSAVNGDAGSQFLDEKELEVAWIAANATAANGNCGLLNNCKANCTRLQCLPLLSDLQQTRCTVVENNEYCGQQDNNTCTFMMVNYKRSYLTLPPPGNPANIGPEVEQDICLSRTLDTTFSNISFPQNYSYVFFGTTSGAWRGFPGRDASDLRCTAYETRERPWYLDGISVSKQIKIIIDTGNSMGTAVNGEYGRGIGTTYLNMTQILTVELLKTVSPGDFVDITTYNFSGSTSLGAPVNILPYNTTNPEVHVELGSLIDTVTHLTPSVDPQASNLTAAIQSVVSNFQNTTTPSLKVILIFTDGNFSPLNSATFPTSKLLDSQVKVILYKLPRSSDTDPFLLGTSLQQLLCGVQGNFELLDAPATKNPLYSIRSYYTFLAHTHMAAVANNATWSNVYQSYSQELNVVTVTYPAFGSNGLLVGVAGIDVFLSQLKGDLNSQVMAALSTRTRGTLPAPTNLKFVCNYQNQTVVQVCSTNSSLDGVCSQNLDLSNSLQARVCCGDCLAPTSHKKLPFWIWIIVGVVALAFLAIIGTIIYSVFSPKRPLPTIPAHYPGGDGNGQSMNGEDQVDPPYSPPTYKGQD